MINDNIQLINNIKSNMDNLFNMMKTMKEDIKKNNYEYIYNDFEERYKLLLLDLIIIKTLLRDIL
jgi:hypothetical protein